LIVGIVVGIVVGVIVFCCFCLLTKHAKKHEKWCFAPEKDETEHPDKLELTQASSNYTRQSANTVSSEAPRETMGTSAMLPINGQQSALSTTQTSKVLTTTHQLMIHHYHQISKPIKMAKVKCFMLIQKP
jgi:hypothetical protein